MQPSELQIWLLAIRPKTLPASIAPVVIGTALAYGDGVHHLPSAFLCLFGAILIQIGTNLANDYFDFKKGADTQERVGPTRVTQAGLVKPNHMLTATILAFLLAVFISYFIVLRGGWPFLVIGIVSILSGILYTAGPWALGYLGLGDIFVLTFFGPVAVAGTYYLQSFEIDAAVILAGLGPGLISVGILTINNLRDIESDTKSGKKTLAVRFGKSFAQTEYMTVILTASLVPVVIYAAIQDHPLIVLASTISIFAIPAFKTIMATTDGPSLNKTLATTGKLLLIYSALFSLGWILL